MYSCGPPYMAKQKQDDQLKLTYSSYVRTQDVTLKTCRRRWIIGRSGERGSGISMLAARHDDDDDDDVCVYIYIYIFSRIYVRLYIYVYIYLIEPNRHFLSTYFLLILLNCRIDLTFGENWLINLPWLVISQVLSLRHLAIIREECITKVM